MDNDMLAVQSRYTAGLGVPDLPGSTAELYRLISRLAGLASGTDEHPFGAEEASNAVRCLDRYVTETASEFNAVGRDLSTVTGEVELYRFYAGIGDHAQVMCDTLRDVDKNSSLRQPWTILLPKLDQEDVSLADWEASDKSKPRPHTPCKDALEARVQALVAEGLKDMDTDIALFAARTYSRRCSKFHGRAYDLFKSRKFADLADQLDMDDKNLVSLLPDSEKHLEGKYRRLIKFSRDARISKDESGNWGQRQAPLQKEVSQVSRLSSDPAIRAAMEIGRFRPPGLSGPPASSVLTSSPKTYHRHSVSVVPSGTKRPAEGQPPGQPDDKRRHLENDLPGTKEESAKESNLSGQDLLAFLEDSVSFHDLADKLIKLSQKHAGKMFQALIPQIESRLEEAKAGKRDQSTLNTWT